MGVNSGLFMSAPDSYRDASICGFLSDSGIFESLKMFSTIVLINMADLVCNNNDFVNISCTYLFPCLISVELHDHMYLLIYIRLRSLWVDFSLQIFIYKVAFVFYAGIWCYIRLCIGLSQSSLLRFSIKSVCIIYGYT